MTGARNIRSGLPKTLADLNDAIRRASNIVFDLHHGSKPEAFDEAADALYAAFAIARDLARPGNITGCTRHPQGAVDRIPGPDGGQCLICNTFQRRGQRPDRPPITHTAIRQPDPAYAEATAHLTRLPDLGQALIAQAVADLGDDAPYEQLVIHAHRAAATSGGGHGRGQDRHTQRPEGRCG